MQIKVDAKGFVYSVDKPKVWLPQINLKQLEIFNDYHRYLLVEGPRKSSKSFGVANKVIKHAFNVNGAMVGVVCKTIKNAKSAGVWVLLTKMLQKWADPVTGCPGFEITEGPKVAGDSKMSFVRIRNQWGTISEIQCHSLEHAKEVEAKFKGPAYSMFWLSEFDQYCDEAAFHIFCDALRLTPDVPYEDHQIICDCNPPDTGTENWMYDLWFVFRGNKLEGEDGNEPDEAMQLLYDGLHRIRVMIDDNPQLDKRERMEMEARYRKRPSLYARFILGHWVQDVMDGHFSDVWDEAMHVVGSKLTGERIVPTEHCTTLFCGWDMGERNHSFHIIEKVTDTVGTHENGHPITIVSFNVLDELVVLKKMQRKRKVPMSIREFVEMALRKMDFWSDYVQKATGYHVKFRHLSDTSAFEISAKAEKSDAMIALEVSSGRIALEKAKKYPGSNKDKVEIIWDLLHGGRIRVSDQLERTKLMFTNVRRGETKDEYVRNDIHKHPFDSLAYVIIEEAPVDMLRSAMVGRKSTKPKQQHSAVVASI